MVAAPPKRLAGGLLPTVLVGALLTVSGCSASSPPAPYAVTMPRGDLPGWHQVFADDFQHPVPLGQFPQAVAAKWGNSYPDGWKDTTKKGTYMPSQVVSIADGVMNFHIHTSHGVHMVAAAVPTLNGPGSQGGLLYGRFSIRIRADAIPGYKVAMLLWPDSETWPRDGEIDFPEANLDSNVNGYVHLQYGVSPNDQTSFSTPQTLRAWHTATIDWLPTGIAFILDGRTIGTTTARIPNTPMHMIIQSETQILGPPPSDQAAGDIEIAWVTAYSRAQ
jgi:beta-glucanase (GH16 family)